MLSSKRTWSYSLRATQKIMDVTFSKQWIHFLRSLRWPPTSNMLQIVSITVEKSIDRRHVLYTQLSHGEPCLVDTSGFCPRTQDIVDIGDIIGRSYPFCLFEETINAISRRFNQSPGSQIRRTTARNPSGRTHSGVPGQSMYTGRSRGS